MTSKTRTNCIALNEENIWSTVRYWYKFNRVKIFFLIFRPYKMARTLVCRPLHLVCLVLHSWLHPVSQPVKQAVSRNNELLYSYEIWKGQVSWLIVERIQVGASLWLSMLHLLFAGICCLVVCPHKQQSNDLFAVSCDTDSSK